MCEGHCFLCDASMCALLFSNSTNPGCGYLNHAEPSMKLFLQGVRRLSPASLSLSLVELPFSLGHNLSPLASDALSSTSFESHLNV